MIETSDFASRLQRDLDPFVDSALAFVVGDVDGAYLAGVGHVGAAIGLQVEAHNLHGAYFGDLRRQQIDLGADQVGDLKGFLTG